MFQRKHPAKASFLPLLPSSMDVLASMRAFVHSFIWPLPSTSSSVSPLAPHIVSPYVVQLTATFSESHVALPFSRWPHFSGLPLPLPATSCSPKALRPVSSLPQSTFSGNRCSIYTFRCHSWRLPRLRWHWLQSSVSSSYFISGLMNNSGPRKQEHNN